MPKVRVSAARIRSLLANRNMDVDALAQRAVMTVHPRDLITSDQAVEYEDLVELAKVFSRPWSYLLIDAAEVYPDAGSDNRTATTEQIGEFPSVLRRPIRIATFADNYEFLLTKFEELRAWEPPKKSQQ